MGQFQRKKPFSGKQKKVQLKLKQQRRSNREADHGDEGVTSPGDGGAASSSSTTLVGAVAADRYSSYTREVVSINKQPQQRSGRSGRDSRFNLELSRAKLDAEFERAKKEMHESIETADPALLEYCSEDFFPPGLTFPQRPAGYQSMSKEQLHMLETRSVRLYGEEMEKLFSQADINLYEQNVETWKQLWRVFDKSDVLLFIVDMRFAVCQFPPYVYRELRQQGRGVVLVLNKVDLVPAALVLAWQQYFAHTCPGLKVVPFCSHESVVDNVRKTRLALNSCRSLIAATQAVAPTNVDLSSWRQQLEFEAQSRTDIDNHNSKYGGKPGDEEDSDDSDTELQWLTKKQYRNKQQQLSGSKQKKKGKFKRRGKRQEGEMSEESEDPDSDDNIQDSEINEAGAAGGVDASSGLPRPFTIGTIGYPNVGKSSLINAIMGKYMVSVSQTPGHTRHFQTHFLTAARDVMLCDCPGLIFPAICPYKLQVLSGTFPVSQVRAPMAVVGFLASHINVARALGLKIPDEYRQDLPTEAPPQWTPFIMSEAWALKRRYYAKGKGGRLDCSRAANELLRLSLAAKNKLVLSLRPQGYSDNKHKFEKHPDIGAIHLTQGLHAKEALVQEKILGFQRIPRGARLDTLVEETAASDTSLVQDIAGAVQDCEVHSSLGNESSDDESRPSDDEIRPSEDDIRSSDDEIRPSEDESRPSSHNDELTPYKEGNSCKGLNSDNAENFSNNSCAQQTPDINKVERLQDLNIETKNNVIDK